MSSNYTINDIGAKSIVIRHRQWKDETGWNAVRVGRQYRTTTSDTESKSYT
jgi:hypothetical protein